LGTTIELQIGGITIDGSRNSMGVDHGTLFQSDDFALRPSDQINYEHYEKHPDEDVELQEACFVRTLSKVIPRLNLLGYTIEAAKTEYENVLQEMKEIWESISAIVSEFPDYMTFNEFCQFVSDNPIANLSKVTNFENAQIAKGRFANQQDAIARIPNSRRYKFKYQWASCGNRVLLGFKLFN
jgi:hypothetical protein